MPPSMINTPEASDSANAVGDTLVSVVAEVICKILPPWYILTKKAVQCTAIVLNVPLEGQHLV